MNTQIGFATIKGKPIDIKGNVSMIRAIKTLAKFGLITFSRVIQFKSSGYPVCFFKPTEVMKSMYNLGNEILVVCCTDGMKDFKSRTKDFIDYMLVTNTEFKNRLDKVTCFLIDGDIDIVNIIKRDRVENPDTRLIVPFYIEELNNSFDENTLSNRMREFLYEKDLFGIASPLKNDMLFFGKDRTNIISELYARYKQGEAGGLFGLRRIGKTSILNLLKLRVDDSGGIAVYFDCSGLHHHRWNELLKYIIIDIVDQYAGYNTEDERESEYSKINFDLGEDRYNEKNAVQSFHNDISRIYNIFGKNRILVILDEIESISFSTSPAKWWREENDSLYFWQTIRALLQMHSEYLAFTIAGVNPMCVETPLINGYDNPIFGMINPIYTTLFEYDDIKNMISSIGGRLGISFEDTVYGKLMEDYGGHPFLTRQVCSKINNDLNARHVRRPTVVTRNSYSLKCDEYKQGMTSVIEQILGVIENYYPGEFELLKRLALDGRESFRKEIALGNIGIQHLIGYCIIEKENGEYFIRIKSIEDYIKSKFVYDATLTEQKDKRARINIRRDNIEEGLRELIQFSLKSKYGKKAKDQLIAMVDKTTQDSTQKTKMINAVSLKDAIQELYFSQIKIIMEKDWKYYEKLFPDKTKFEAYMDVLNKSRSAGAHTRTISADDEVIYNIAFDFFEEAIKED